MFMLAQLFKTDGQCIIFPNGFTDLHDATGNLRQGEWRGLVSWNQGSMPINLVKGSRYSNEAIKMRNAIEDFVNSEEGTVS